MNNHIGEEGRTSTSAAPGIDLATAIRNCCEAEQADPDHPDTICINVNDLTAIIQQCLIDASPKGDVPRADVVPGVMRCAKCSFQLHRTNLYMGSGTTGHGDSKTEPCPNGCGPLWPVTWETWATEGWEQAERYHGELRQLQASPKGECTQLGYTLADVHDAYSRGKNAASPKGGSTDAKDAERWRWLKAERIQLWRDSNTGAPVSCSFDFDEPGHDIDAAIDAAMQATSAEVGA